MAFGSCRFLFHELVRRDITHEITGNMDCPAPLAAAPIRRFHINRLHRPVLTGRFYVPGIPVFVFFSASITQMS